MNFRDICEKRQSCRSFDSSKTVETEKLDSCLEAARLAPSAYNSQPYRIWAVTGEKAKLMADYEKSGVGKFCADCSTYVVFTEDDYSDMAKAGAEAKGLDFRSIDLGIAVAYLTAEAAEKGLDSCIMASFSDKNVRKIIGADRRVMMVVALGYRKSDDSQRVKKRKSSDELIVRV